MYKDVVKFIKETYNTDKFIPLHQPRFWGNEKKYLNDCIDSTFVSSVGKYVDEFEKMIRDYTGAKYAIATVNGTAALHISLILAGVKKDELVITQPLCFIATSNAISYIGASPLFVDVNKHTMGLCPQKLVKYLKDNCEIKFDGCYHTLSGKKISACVPMHTFGHPCEMDELMQVCNEYKIVLVEDAAESIGSMYKGKQTGTIGKIGAYSFNGNKTITCGGGGIIVTDDEAIGKRAKHITTTAKIPHRWAFEHDEIGYNYRLPNINAALACAQMEQLDGFLKEKRILSEEYKSFFSSRSETFISEPKDCKSNYWLNAILLKDKKEKDEFLTYTNDSGVMTRPIWVPMHKIEMFKNCYRGDLENTEWLEDRIVNFPSSVMKK
jgi:perosamine synthetase